MLLQPCISPGHILEFCFGCGHLRKRAWTIIEVPIFAPLLLYRSRVLAYNSRQSSYCERTGTSPGHASACALKKRANTHNNLSNPPSHFSAWEEPPARYIKRMKPIFANLIAQTLALSFTLTTLAIPCPLPEAFDGKPGKKKKTYQLVA